MRLVNKNSSHRFDAAEQSWGNVTVASFRFALFLSFFFFFFFFFFFVEQRTTRAICGQMAFTEALAHVLVTTVLQDREKKGKGKVPLDNMIRGEGWVGTAVEEQSRRLKFIDIMIEGRMNYS